MKKKKTVAICLAIACIVVFVVMIAVVENSNYYNIHTKLLNEKGKELASFTETLNKNKVEFISLKRLFPYEPDQKYHKGFWFIESKQIIDEKTIDTIVQTMDNLRNYYIDTVFVNSERATFYLNKSSYLVYYNNVKNIDDVRKENEADIKNIKKINENWWRIEY